MLDIIKSTIPMTVEAARRKYTSSKVIILLNNTDTTNLSGILYAISNDESSFQELCKESDRLRKLGKQNIIVGTYNNGGVVGVQHLLEEDNT